MPLEDGQLQGEPNQFPADQELDTPAPPVAKQRIKNPIAEFTGVDKITAASSLSTSTVKRDRAVRRAAGDAARLLLAAEGGRAEDGLPSSSVDEITLDRKIRRIFTGWISPRARG